MSIPNPNYLQADLIWRQLSAAGVKEVVISPGSRSTPLARTAFLNRELSCHVITDERSAGFFALGLCKGSHAPVALVCTSGTAAAHYYPAVIEASQSGYLLVVLSADRPQAARNTGAPQTIDQVALFGRYARMAIDLPGPRATADSMREMLYWVRHALDAMLNSPAGPVQINVPMDEPLAPQELEQELCGRLFAELHNEFTPIDSAQKPSLTQNIQLCEAIEAALCGLIVCGPDAARNEAERENILTLARSSGFPILADVCSGLRFSGEPNLPMYDLFLRHESLFMLAPDFVLEFGGPPTSKVLTQYLNKHRATTVRIQRDTLPRDPDHRATHTVIADVPKYVSGIAKSVVAARDSLLLDPFWKASGALRAACSHVLFDSESELAYVKEIVELLPDHSNLVLASSMPVRYADMMAMPIGKRIDVYAQRGTNGIDGVLSHAAGIARATQKQTVLICGDLAFLHDLHGLRLVRDTENLTVFILNNNGGGIFHFLPIAEHRESFEELHGTPHSLDVAKFCEATGLTCVHVAAPAQVQMAMRETSHRVFEVITQRDANRAAHEQVVAELLKALA